MSNPRSIQPVGHIEFLMRQKFREVFRHNPKCLTTIQKSKLWKLVGTKQELVNIKHD